MTSPIPLTNPVTHEPMAAAIATASSTGVAMMTKARVKPTHVFISILKPCFTFEVDSGLEISTSDVYKSNPTVES